MNAIVGTGLSGLVGTRIQELLREYYTFEDLSLKTHVDITNVEQVQKRVGESLASTILHMAAITDVDACEDDKILGEEGAAWRVNVEGTRNIIDAARKTGKKVIYISTDFVFDGTKEFYIETDTPNPLNWYGYTKYMGESIVTDSGVEFVIFRLAYPYRAEFSEKMDFVRRIIEKLTHKEKIFSLTDHIFTPTFIDDFAIAIDEVIRQNAEGIFHAVGSESLTPDEATKRIMDVFQLTGDVEKTTREVFFHDRAFRPCRLALKNDKIARLGVKMLGFAEGLSEMKKQLTFQEKKT
ncbi:NAD(P)-dependent oxidoreductase [Candidatus Gottesmanbacteria bacterium]|nr:NAD(P)-dependent oxidoreductase [Candidatus Gottesmanbacteria bacterium]